ncbi:MAG: hypothetical protein KA781_08995 [Aquabacterium sp.]|nr:hypothetical protein [Aquabacterium sp.]
MSLLAATAESRSPKNKPRVVPADTQQVCIDLPGEDVRCVVHKPKLEILLRKHRDVIFEIQLFKGMSYTVEADQGDFYNARDKKIVQHTKKQTVTFKDGERLHLWIARNFKGNLILKANGKVLGRYQPSTLDQTRYDAEPTTKPAPMMIVLKNEAKPTLTSVASSTTCKANDPLGIDQWTLHAVPTAFGLDALTMYSRNRPTTPVAEQHPTVAVIDGDSKGMPQKLRDYFATGGGKSGMADVDPNEVITRNWLLGQLTGVAAYAGDNWNWLRHSINKQADGAFKLVSAKVAYVRGKVRIYFAGYSAKNPVFGPGGHDPGNSKILQIYAGIGKAGSAFKSIAMAMGGTFKNNALFSFIFGSYTSWEEWQVDAQKDRYDLAAALVTSLVKAVVAAVLTAIVVVAILFVLMVFAKITVAAIVVGAMTLITGWAANYGIEAVDKQIGKAWLGQSNSDGTAAGVAPWLRSAGKWLAESWDHLNAKFPNDYQPWAAL